MLMQAFLYGISALVIVAFLTVWTVQRTRDIAVVKAMGGSPGYVLRDAMVQAVIVLAAGTLAGGGLGLLGGFLAAQAAPFLLTPATTLLPVAGILLLGLAGAAAGRPRRHPRGPPARPRRQLNPCCNTSYIPRKEYSLDTALNLVNVTLEYPDGDGTLKALDHVSLAARRRGVPGPGGPVRVRKVLPAGRRRDAGPPTSGLVTIDGQEATGLRDAGLTALRREKVGIIFQQPNLLPSLTAVDQLLLADHLRGKPCAAARRTGSGAAGHRRTRAGPGQAPAPALRRPAPAGEHCARPDGAPCRAARGRTDGGTGPRRGAERSSGSCGRSRTNSAWPP